MTDWLERHRGVLFTTLIGLIVLGGIVFLLRRPTPEAIEILPPPLPTPPPPAIVIVYVSGAVIRPDVYTLPEGSRIKEAVEAAGGFTAQADRDRINLARRLHDEEQIYVLQIGEENPPVPPSTTTGSTSHPGEKINLNTATVADLESLPGIGPTYAQRIIEYRKQNGPFQQIEGIMKVQGIGEATFEKIRDRISVQ